MKRNSNLYLLAVIAAVTNLRFVFIFENEGAILPIGYDLKDVFKGNLPNHDSVIIPSNHCLNEFVVDIKEAVFDIFVF